MVVVHHQGELVKSAMFHEDLVSAYVLSDTDLDLIKAWLTKDGREFNIVKRVNFSYPVSETASRRKVIKKIAERFASMAVFMGRRNPEETLWKWISYANYRVHRLLPVTGILGIDKEKFILEILSVHRLQGLRFNLRHQLYLNKNSAGLRHEEQESGSEEAESPTFRTAFGVGSDDIGSMEDNSSSPNHNNKAVLLNSISIIRRELPEPCLGWPLLRRKSRANQESKKVEAQDTSVIEWVMRLPDRGVDRIAFHPDQASIDDETNSNDSSLDNHKIEYYAEDSYSLTTEDSESNSMPGWPLQRITSSTSSDSSFAESENIKMLLPMAEGVLNNHVQFENSLPTLRKMPNDLELRCKQFTLGELKQATSGFSPENFIGEGGCSNVYKGFLPNGNPVAVKILKSYKEVWIDFSLEVDIVSSLKHKHITPLTGVCVENDHLISVYDFVPRGSLEETLHGQSKKSVLPWEVRFKMAISIAEALNYLHNECSPPVIHRDVKSSNILLSDDLQPQLSDFGLAIWGPVDSTCMIDSNVVGTFGYIAPEYFMEGRVSDKIDVYSFGVVLLELLSGRRPVSSKATEKQESLIQWASTLLETRNLRGLVDPALDGDFDVDQMNRMVLAATCCLNQSDIYRPNATQILEILQGEKEPTEKYHFNATYMKVPDNQEDYGFCEWNPSRSTGCSDSESEHKNHTKIRCKTVKHRRLMLKEYLQQKQY